MTVEIPNDSEVWFDSVAKVAANIEGIAAVFAGGRADLDTAEGRPRIQPMIDEELLTTPAAVLFAGEWEIVGASGQDQITHQVQLLIWVPRHPILTAYAEAIAFRQRAMAAFPPHSKAYEHLPDLQWVKVLGGSGIDPRTWPEGSANQYLVVPVDLEVRVNTSIRYLPQ